MSVPNRQIGQASSTEASLLHDILKQIYRLTGVISASGGGGGSGSVTSVTGTSDRITITGTPTIAPVVDIAATYIGQSSITTVGALTNGSTGAGFTIALSTSTVTGTLSPLRGGTGISNNAASTLTISGAFATTLTVTGVTAITLPTSGTLLNSTQAWLLASGGTLTGNNTIVQAGFNTTFTGIGKVSFSPTTGGGSVAGLNAGTVAGDPGTLANGDIWFNTSTGAPMMRNASNTRIIAYLTSAGGTTNRIYFGVSGSGLLTDSSNLTFVTNRLIGATLYLTLSAGAAAAGSGPLIMTSGTNLTTPINGCFEYNGTNLFFTRSGAVREGILTQSAVTTEVIVSDTSITVNIGGTTYRLLARA